ncbi:MAG: ParA family protein, partial [Armatimonadetes bacterium]|nr:ParA family protein [Armatimonadota bacterium]
SATSFFVGADYRAPVSIHDVLFEGARLDDALLPITPKLSVVPGAAKMEDADRLLPSITGADTVLFRAFRALQTPFDVVLLDVPSGWGATARNALLAATHHLLPINSEQMALDTAHSTLAHSVGLFEAYDRETLPFAALLTAFRETHSSHDIEAQCRGFWPQNTLQTRIRYTEQIKELAATRKTVAQRQAATAREDFAALGDEILKSWQPKLRNRKK